MSAENGNGSVGNGNGNGWMKTVLVALATLALGGGAGATVSRESHPTITQAELTAIKVFEAETKLRLAAHDDAFESINMKLDILVKQKEGK